MKGSLYPHPKGGWESQVENHWPEVSLLVLTSYSGLSVSLILSGGFWQAVVSNTWPLVSWGESSCPYLASISKETHVNNLNQQRQFIIKEGYANTQLIWWACPGFGYMNHPQGHLPLGKRSSDLEPPSRCQCRHPWDVTMWYIPQSKLLLYRTFTGKSSIFCLFSLVRQRGCPLWVDPVTEERRYWG